MEVPESDVATEETDVSHESMDNSSNGVSENDVLTATGVSDELTADSKEAVSGGADEGTEFDSDTSGNTTADPVIEGNVGDQDTIGNTTTDPVIEGNVGDQDTSGNTTTDPVIEGIVGDQDTSGNTTTDPMTEGSVGDQDTSGNTITDPVIEGSVGDQDTSGNTTTDPVIEGIVGDQDTSGNTTTDPMTEGSVGDQDTSGNTTTDPVIEGSVGDQDTHGNTITDPVIEGSVGDQDTSGNTTTDPVIEGSVGDQETSGNTTTDPVIEGSVGDQDQQPLSVSDNLNEDASGGRIEEKLSAIRKEEIDYQYDNVTLISKPYCTDDLPLDLLNLHHSFGFECTKRSNLHLLTNDHVIFSTGNVFQILNLKTKEQINMRSCSGGGIGAIAVHPGKLYFAVSEKGIKPNIIIYQYPSLKICRVLREGTEEAYANLDFSPSGEKLASVGSYPDYMLTIWDWWNESIILRSKAFSQDVYKVAFSPEDEGHLCSSGTGHIKFWSMASTFTGLKLQGELGRFGTTELSDISGFVELPDGKVLSGSEWGNMLLWDGGLIKVEIARKGKKTCHQGNIEQFFLDEGELITTGLDGYVKVWDFECIDSAEPVDQSKLYELEPMSELKVGNHVKILSLVKSVDEEESSMWYAQDGAGGIWKLDLSFSHTSLAPEKLFSYHAGRISSLAVSPLTHVAASTGVDGTVRLYDYIAKTPLCYKRYKAAGCSVLWVPKMVDETCSSMLVGFADGVVRLLSMKKSGDGLSKVKETDVSLHLMQVLKPHLQPVTCLTIDGQGKTLATCSDDGTLFFFNIKANNYEPIGFVVLGGGVASSLQWSSITMGEKLLVTCKDGSVFELSKPLPGMHDTAHSFEIPLDSLMVNKYKFTSIKADILKAEEEERKKIEAANKKEVSEKEQEEEEDQIKEEEEEQTGQSTESGKDDEAKLVISQSQGETLFGFYAPGKDNFILSLDGFDAGYLYECAFIEQPSDNTETIVKPIKIPELNDVTITSLKFTKNQSFLVLGLSDGSIRIQNLKTSSWDALQSYWCVNAHDNLYGAISDIALSYDNKFLISAGNDGNLFVYKFFDDADLQDGSIKYEIDLKLDEITMNPPDDIDDPKHYSIELEKQKAEHDKMVQLAEEKKQHTKNMIGQLRREFRKQKGKNDELPLYLQLGSAEFVIDPHMKNSIEEETKMKLTLLHKETGFESARFELGLFKLQERYMEMVQYDRIVLHACLSKYSVSSYRQSKLSDGFFKLIKENYRKMTLKLNDRTLYSQGNRRGSTLMREKKRGGSISSEKMPDKSEFVASRKTQNLPERKLDGKIAKVIEKAEERRQLRLNRQKEWEELYKNKPDENYENPQDAVEIRDAEFSIGDFKLKTAGDFVVPEEQRVNAERKTHQLLELKEKSHNLKEEFNERLFLLRNKKVVLISELEKMISTLEDVQSKLPDECHLTIPQLPSMLSEEIPEKVMEYTNESLITFRRDVLGIGSMNNPSDETQVNITVSGELHDNNTQSKSRSTRGVVTDQHTHSTSILSTYSSVHNSGSSFQCESPVLRKGDEQRSKMEIIIHEEETVRLTYQRDCLLKSIHEKLLMFDAELRLLRHEKIHLDTVLKNAELREVTLFEEMLLLKDFEKRERHLQHKVMQKIEEKEDMEDKLDECKESVGIKKTELEKLQEKEKTLFQTFLDTIGENNKFEGFLTKVYRKKIKRTKKSLAVEEEDDSDEEDSEDEYSTSEDEDSGEEELDDSVCPAGCDPLVFDQICALRERRMDVEEALIETRKAHDGMKKELDTLAKKVKAIDTALKNAGSEVEAFQREKQQKLNELDVVVTLRLDQIQYIQSKTIPQDLSKCLIFENGFLQGLQRRIKELEREKVKQKQEFKACKQRHVQMNRDRKTMEVRIKEYEEKVESIQMLKFGRKVDLEKLETVSVNRVAEELKEKLREQEQCNARELVKWDDHIDHLQTELTKLIRENTKHLRTTTLLHRNNQKLEQQLDSRQKDLGSEFQGNRKTDVVERQRLVHLVQIQSQEIESLKDEIMVLSRKGGHIMPPPRSLLPSQGAGVVL